MYSFDCNAGEYFDFRVTATVPRFSVSVLHRPYSALLTAASGNDLIFGFEEMTSSAD